MRLANILLTGYVTLTFIYTYYLVVDILSLA